MIFANLIHKHSNSMSQGGGGGSGYTDGSATIISTQQGGHTGTAQVIFKVL